MKKTIVTLCAILIAGFAQADPKHEKQFSLMDANADGKVTLEEFLTFSTATFERQDKNGDGSLDESESAQGFASFDTDKDGKISLEEYKAVREKHFKVTDANGDGFLTLEELEAQKQKSQKPQEDKSGGE